MARKPSPWWWDDEQGWYVNLEGKRRFLGKHPEGAAKPKRGKKGKWNTPKQIDDAFYKLMGVDKAEVPPPPPKTDRVADVLDDFIIWCREHRAAITTDRYQEFCQDFINHKQDGEKVGKLSVNDLSSKHVNDWLADRGSWAGTTKRNAITAVQRALNWACKNRGLSNNPIRGMEKPEATQRVEFVTPAEFEKLLKAIPDQRFIDLLLVSYDSGARPFEIKDLEARHVDLEKHRAVLPKDEAKGRKHPRAFYFPTERSMAVIARLHRENTNGPMFKNRLGNKWTALAVKCRLEDLDNVLGRRVTHYSLRHSRITEWLVSGTDSHVVAKLAGHRDTKMLDTVYSHVADDYEYMLKQASGSKKKSTVNGTQSEGESE